MTILEDNVTSTRNKLSLSKQNRKKDHNDLKRTSTQLFEDSYHNQPPPAKKQFLAASSSSDMLNGYRGDTQQRSNGGDGALLQDSPVATLSNMGNTCFLNSVLYALRFTPTFLHNLHHLIGDLASINGRLNQNKVKTSSLGRNITALTGGPGSNRSTSSKDLLSLGVNVNNDILPKSKVQIVTEKLHELFMTMHNLEIKESTDPYQPVAFLQAVREANYIFEGNHQQDAHELLLYLLDNIRETCDILTQQVQQNPQLLVNEVVETNTSLPPPQSTNNSSMSSSSKIWNVRRSWKKNYNKAVKKSDKTMAICEEHVVNQNGTNGSVNTDIEDSNSVDGNAPSSKTTKKLCYNFVAEDFEGITLRRTKCLECECVTERKEPFYDIPVPISIKEDDIDPSNTIHPSEIYRRACVTTEKLCDANKYLCEQCQRYNEASREVLFEKLPNIMVLQLKRFSTTSAGVQKVNTFMPTPLELKCFCESCCNVQTVEEKDNIITSHRYQLCCVIMHLGGTMASGHYIAYVKAGENFFDYSDCSRDVARVNSTGSGSLSASSSEKALNILKLLKPRALSSSSFLDSKNGLSSGSRVTSASTIANNGVRICSSVECCGVRLNKNVVENVINAMGKRNQDNWTQPTVPSSQDDMWLECDDENIRAISSQELEEELGYKPNSTSTPYLLFYAKID